jgi:hypothetical protein
MSMKFWNNKVAMGTVAGAVVGALVVLPVTSALAASNSSSTPPVTTTVAAQHPVVKKAVQRHRVIKVKLTRQLAKALDITPKQLISDIKSGESLQQIASSKGISMSTVESSLKRSIDTAVNQRVDTWVSKHWAETK